MRDSYTLIIPTYNRSKSLERLLGYLSAQNADFLVDVLDSSRPDEREANRRTIANSSLKCRHIEYPEKTHPFDKFREGIASVTTPLCALCADDDIPIMSGTRASVDFLLRNPDYGVAHGYYFQFAESPREIRLANFTYYTPSMDMDQPLARVHALMRHYQALTYGTYRTEVLQKVFDGVRPVSSILARELLSSVLAVVYGKVARLPVIYHGRSLGPSATYQNWHPLEWLLRDGKGLFGEYSLYRELLAEAVLAQASNDYSTEEAYRVIDIIHMQYLVRHIPEHALDHMVLEILRGATPEEVFRSPTVAMGLVHAADHYVPLGSQDANVSPARAPLHGKHTGDVVAMPARSGNVRQNLVRRLDQHTPGLAARLRKVKTYVEGSRTQAVLAEPAEAVAAGVEQLQSSIKTPVREYKLAPAFISPPDAFAVEIDNAAKLQLVAALDDYSN